MKVKINIEKYTFDINIGQGMQDFAWLALVAARVYGKHVVPSGNYTPIYLKIGDFEVPHPR